MNVDLAMTALDGITRSPLTIQVDDSQLTIRGSSASMKELARLCLLIAADSDGEEAWFELQRSTHLTPGSPALRVVVSP